MAKKTHKYQLKNVTKEQNIFLPHGAAILKIGEQNDTITIWAIIDTDQPDVEYKFRVFATGEEIYQNLAAFYYLGTVQMKNGLVWHVFLQGEYGQSKGIFNAQSWATV